MWIPTRNYSQVLITVIAGLKSYQTSDFSLPLVISLLAESVNLVMLTAVTSAPGNYWVPWICWNPSDPRRRLPYGLVLLHSESMRTGLAPNWTPQSRLCLIQQGPPPFLPTHREKPWDETTAAVLAWSQNTGRVTRRTELVFFLTLIQSGNNNGMSLRGLKRDPSTLWSRPSPENALKFYYNDLSSSHKKECQPFVIQIMEIQSFDLYDIFSSFISSYHLYHNLDTNSRQSILK